jgi:hypothetical protein
MPVKQIKTDLHLIATARIVPTPYHVGTPKFAVASVVRMTVVLQQSLFIQA